jgi:Flp pilus assembly protein TadG
MGALRRLQGERGQTAVEFALITPIILVLLLGVIQVGMAFHDYITLTDAARAGARKAVVVRFTGQTNAQLQQNVRDAAGDLNQSNLQVTVSTPSPLASGGTVTVTATYPYSIDLLGFVVASGNLTSTMTDRLE